MPFTKFVWNTNSLYTSACRPTRTSVFCSMKRLRVFLLPLDGMLVHRRVTLAGTHLYSWVERGTVRVMYPAQALNTLPPARAATQIARSGVLHLPTFLPASPLPPLPLPFALLTLLLPGFFPHLFSSPLLLFLHPRFSIYPANFPRHYLYAISKRDAVYALIFTSKLNCDSSRWLLEKVETVTMWLASSLLVPRFRLFSIDRVFSCQRMEFFPM